MNSATPHTASNDSDKRLSTTMMLKSPMAKMKTASHLVQYMANVVYKVPGNHNFDKCIEFSASWNANFSFA